MTTFHEPASAGLTAKAQGVLGGKPIDANTRADYRWRLTRHLLPFFAAYPLDKIDRNPARGERCVVRVPKPTRTFLEMDELVG